MKRPEHNNPDCTGTWLAWCACSESHPGWLKCQQCGASHMATPELLAAMLEEELNLLAALDFDG